MAFFDRFKKDTTNLRMAAILDPSAPAGPDELRPPVLIDLILEQSDVAVPFRDSEVAAANRMTAEGIVRGEHTHLPEVVSDWFQTNQHRAVSPTHIGYTWYPGHTTAQMQLVDTRALELDPNPRVGSLLWGSRSVIDRWVVSPIEISNDDGRLTWLAPGEIRDIEMMDTTEDDVFVMMLVIGADLGSALLEQEFQMVLSTAVHFTDGFDQSDIDNSLPRLWSVTGSGRPEDLIRAAVLSLYALGDRLPVELQQALPVADTAGPAPRSLVPEIAAKMVQQSAVERGGTADPAVVAKAAELTAAATSVNTEPPSVPAIENAATVEVQSSPGAVSGPYALEHEFSSYQKLIDEGVELPIGDPRFERKLRSEERLQAHGVPTLAWMSFIDGEDEVAIRPQDEVINRAICLMAMAVKSEIMRDGDWSKESGTVDGILDGYGVRGSLTPAELKYLQDPAPDEHTSTQFLWRYESCWALLWALGLIDELTWPATICDVPFACGLVQDLGPAGIREQAKLRSAAEILEEADHIYRLHWAVRQASRNSDFSVPAEPGVVMERHYALNWLRTYNDQEWDRVSTDT